MYRIAHISDTHVSPEYNRYNVVKLRSLLSFIIDDGYDHIAITGDITGQGEVRDFRSVRRVLKYFGLLDYNKLSVTIGNHDIFGGVHRAEDLFSFKTHCRSTDYDAKLKTFEQAFKETFSRKAFSSQGLFPFIKLVGPVAFVGLNSISKFHPFRNPFGSNGHVPREQLQSAEAILNHPSVAGFSKIMLIHHHFSKYRPYDDSIADKLYHRFESQTLKLYGRKKVEELLARFEVDAVLHGHTHISEIYRKAGVLFSSTALNTTRAESDTDSQDELSGFNEIVIEDGGNVEVTKRRTAVLPKGSSYIASEKNSD